MAYRVKPHRPEFLKAIGAAAIECTKWFRELAAAESAEQKQQAPEPRKDRVPPSYLDPELLERVKQQCEDHYRATERCFVREFTENEQFKTVGSQVDQNRPLFISCPCSRCSPFTL